jgi:hypothetical protein
MSNTNANDNAGQTDPAVQSGSGGSRPPEKKKQGNPGLPTIEEHAKNLNIDAPVFEAVMQSEKWANGKRVPESVFKKAVEAFLGAPMGGR